MLAEAAFGLLFAAGLAAAVLGLSRGLTRSLNLAGPARTLRLAFTMRRSGADQERPDRKARRAAALSALNGVQAVSGIAGALVGLWATGLAGMAALLGGLGVLLPPFMAAPRRRRRHTRVALAWQMWSRQLAEQARAGAGLLEALRGSVDHAPSEIADLVAQTAVTGEIHGLEAAFEELARAGTVWEPEVAAGLRMAATSGGAVAEPLLDLCERIGDTVDLHRSRTEAVVQLWTQTIALLGLAGGVVLLMYRNNPAYFAPYRTSTGQMVFALIASVLLLSVSFLVRHSVVREANSVLVMPRRLRRSRTPL